MTTKLPTEDRPIQLGADISPEVEEMLEPYEGEELELARKAVLRVYRSGFTGSHGAILDEYRAAIEDAVG